VRFTAASHAHRTVDFSTALGELAADLDVRLSTMTGVVDQLEERGLVERLDHPADRRSLRVEFTEKGRKLYQGAHHAFLSHLEPLLDGRTSAARQHILDFLADAIRAIQGWRDNPRKVRRHGKKVRSVEVADTQAVRAIYAPFVSDNATSFEAVVPDLAEMERRIQTQRDRYPWLVFERDRMVLGYAYASAHRARKAYQWCVEVSLYVHPHQ
jgi:DNA-binding MarR family transcriptional regulator